MPKPVRSVADFIDVLEANPAPRGQIQLFRGHDTSGLEPEPKVFRSTHSKTEHRSIREFVSAFPQEFDRDATTLEKMVRAQHFGIPTRLLDLTWNPLVALYFACAAQPNKNGEVLVYTMLKSRLKYYDSDSVSILSNLAYLTPNEKEGIIKLMDSSFIFDDSDIDDFNKEEVMRPLMHYIRAEKPHFMSRVDPDDLSSMYFVKPKLNNRRILAQSGAFAIYGPGVPSRNRRNFMLTRHSVPLESKKDILITLDLLNIHNSSVFPEVENAASYIQSRI